MRKLSLESMRAKWLCRQIHSPADHRLNAAGRHPRQVTNLWYSAESELFFAFAGVHLHARTLRGLDRILTKLS